MDLGSAWTSLMDEGYAVIRGAVDAKVCDDINQRIANFKQRNAKAVARNLDEHGRLYRVVNLHLAVDAITQLLVRNAAIGVCDRFFGEPTSLYTTLYYERGSEQSLHRDTPMFCTTPSERYLGVWVALDDVSDDNGPLRVVPRSHLLPPIDLARMRRDVFGDGSIAPLSPEGWNAYQEEVQRQCNEANLAFLPMHAQRGDVIVWHPQLFHGGAPHLSPRTRRSVVMHVTPKGVPVGHMDVFFDPAKAVSRAKWGYYQRGDRHVAKFKRVDFGHEYGYRTWRLRRA
ncbi:phytanoyl-CoA dioxygenase family protein [Dyella japonica]|uniref:Phytanoyl-CoA dioxygenase n=1 Tax=Dyella japonica A8 TaxID=1217721 RepID=A0A075K4T4_9GAMM|nr:phytanoyl-CoA dioxygenase family protein [Dyella japonica]AIF49236.1 phytanoyl-CoA dioxygenase [Dyella japonica A8]